MICGSSDATMDIYTVFLNSVGANKMVSDTEVEEVIWVNKSELFKLFAQGLIQDSKTLMAYYHYMAYSGTN